MVFYFILIIGIVEYFMVDYNLLCWINNYLKRNFMFVIIFVNSKGGSGKMISVLLLVCVFFELKLIIIIDVDFC